MCAPDLMETCETCATDCGDCPPPMPCGDGICSAADFETCFRCPADCGMCGTDSCRDTLICASGCETGGVGGAVCLGNCLARACSSARMLIFDSLGCIQMSGCGTDIACLLGACPELFACFTHEC
jgi:hypothetical protein